MLDGMTSRSFATVMLAETEVGGQELVLWMVSVRSERLCCEPGLAVVKQISGGG